MAETILVTGGAGYIRSHTVFQVLLAGHKVLVVDNLANSSVSIKRVQEFSSDYGRNLSFHKVMVLGCEKEGIRVEIIHNLDACIDIPQLGVVRSLNVHVSGAYSL